MMKVKISLSVILILSYNIRNTSGIKEDEDEEDQINVSVPFWEAINHQQVPRTIQSSTSEVGPNTTPLKDFLDTYIKNSNDNIENNNNGKSKKSWNLIVTNKNTHQTDTMKNEKGWVKMEPIPWSISKISKWQPQFNDDRPNFWNGNEPVRKKPLQNVEIVPHSRPIFVVESKPDIPNFPFYSDRRETNINNFDYDNSRGIITDGKPADFPFRFNQESTHRSLSGKGEWKLISTNKGYKNASRGGRALQVQPAVIGTRKSVKLLVLPPLKDSKVNMTTSHGGLLQVDSTFETVDQARRKYQILQRKKQKNKIQMNTNNKKANNKKTNNKNKVTKSVIDSRVAAIPRKQDGSAILAAIGAGMIPATMAMLVPMAMNG